MGKQRDGLANLRPFVPGDPRINRRGRPKNFDAFRELAQAIAHEPDPQNPSMTRLENILRNWAASKEVAKQLAFVQYGYGKPPEKVDLDVLKPKTVLRLYWPHERPDLLEHDYPSFRVRRHNEKLGDTGVVGRNLPGLNGEKGEPEPESPPTP